jgi:ribosomal protein L37AE/L43A
MRVLLTFYKNPYNLQQQGVNMSKAHRGSGLKDQPKGGRGKCPVCKKTGIKIVYEYEFEGKKIKICKNCKATIAHGKKQDVLAAL